MAPPLLPITRLITCSGCSEHVKLGDSHCPHCGAAIAATGGFARAALTAAAIAGVLSSCTAEPDYGVPVTDTATVGDSTETDATGTDAVDTTGDTGSSTDEPTTGVTDTGEQTGTDTGSSDDTGATTTAEPDYGVPGTTSGESDYGVAATH